jgi:hypothetical protein
MTAAAICVELELVKIGAQSALYVAMVGSHQHLFSSIARDCSALLSAHLPHSPWTWSGGDCPSCCCYSRCSVLSGNAWGSTQRFHSGNGSAESESMQDHLLCCTTMSHVREKTDERVRKFGAIL